jgi:hypothetical protein
MCSDFAHKQVRNPAAQIEHPEFSSLDSLPCPTHHTPAWPWLSPERTDGYTSSALVCLVMCCRSLWSVLLYVWAVGHPICTEGHVEAFRAWLLQAKLCDMPGSGLQGHIPRSETAGLGQVHFPDENPNGPHAHWCWVSSVSCSLSGRCEEVSSGFPWSISSFKKHVPVFS